MGSMKDLLGDQTMVFPTPAPAHAFGGKTYEPARDYLRLTGQLEAVYKLMLDGQWHTLTQIQNCVGGSEAAISARLRDLRKVEYGAHDIRKRCVAGGLWEYRMEGK